ncbi:MAG: hypothetical protein JST00_13120 [Deltaproteobacteria bacterium]|nr:hypothetical protein [Deltaproteobacteria bacterium]
MTSPAPPPSLSARIAWRRALVLLAPVAYVAVTAVRTMEASPRAWLAIGLAFATAVWGARTKPDETLSEARARMWTTAALALSIATAATTTRFAPGSVARELALLGAALAAVRALAAIDPDAGLAARASDAIAARGIPAALVTRAATAACVLAWGGAALVDLLAWTNVAPGLADSAPVLASAGGAAALFAVGACALLLAGVRRLELDAPPRAIACAAAVGVGLLLSITFVITTSIHADAAVAIGAAGVFPVVVRLARAKDALAIARGGRRALTLLVFGGPVAAIAAIATEGHMPGVGLVAFGVALATMAIGAAATKLEEPFLPAKGALLDALDDATVAAHDRESRAAITKALLRLREVTGPSSPSPELWMLHPTRIFTVDAAGYLQERDGELPPALLDLAMSEPHRTVRIEVLRALEVRRADLRPLLHWLDDRGMLFATVVTEGEEPDGMVLVPAGVRVDPLTVDEAVRANGFAAAFVAVCQARSARERHLARERALQEHIERLDDELARVRHAASLDGSRNELASARLARPATVGIYSAASRMAYDALERRLHLEAPAVVVARPGIDPVPYIARAHLSGPRKDGPLVVVDGTSSREHDLERWRDERWSPLALADRGLLVLVDGAALPRDVQTLVARTLTERRPPWERAAPLDVAVALTATSALEGLVEEGRLSTELFSRFEGGGAVVLPGLRERPEDLFSIVADRLAREGLRVRGKPVGIDANAYARLVDHPFEGEDAELATIVGRLVASATGEVIRVADVDALGLGSNAAPREADREVDISPSVSRRRRS